MTKPGPASRKSGPPPQLEPVLESLDPTRTERLLLDLIDLYSPSWAEEEVQTWCSRYLVGHGVQVTHQPVGQNGRFNVIATLGDGPVGLLFVGHVDTVVKWFQGDHRSRREGHYIRGLGSADMKSGCASMIEAFIALSKQPHPPDTPAIALALVVGEEDSGDGIQALLGRMVPEVAVVGEPTGMRLCASHFGYLEALLTIHGKRAHSALPEAGRNAIEEMFRIITALTPRLSAPNPELERPPLVCNVREVRGGGNAFVVPEYCEAVLDLHMPPGVKMARIKDEVKAMIRELGAGVSTLRCDLQFKFGFNGYALDEQDVELAPLLDAVADVGLNPPRDAFRSHSDANCLHAAGARPIVIGPGDLHTAHTVDERVSDLELEQATRLYAAMGARYRTARAGTLDR